MAFWDTSAPDFAGDPSRVSNNINNAMNFLHIAGSAAEAASFGDESYCPLSKQPFEALKPEYLNYAGLMKVWWISCMLKDMEKQLEKFKEGKEYHPVPHRSVVHLVFCQAYSLLNPDDPRGKYYREALQQGAKILGLEPVVDLAPSLIGVAVAGTPAKTATHGAAL